MDAEPASNGTVPVAPRARSAARRVVRWVAGIVATLVILLALVLGALRVALAHVPDYRDQIQAWVNDTTHLDVRFRDLDARWRFFGPEIYITAVEVYAPNGGPLLAESRAASVGVDLWRILFRAELLPGRLSLIEPEIGLVRTLDGRIELEGQAALEQQDRRFTIDDLPTGRLDIVDGRLTFTDLKGELRDLILKAVDASVRRDRNDLEIEAQVELPDNMGSTLDIDASAHGALAEPEQLAWQFAARVREIELGGWREQFDSVAALPSSGHGSLRLEASLTGRELTAADLRLQLAQVTLPAVAGGPRAIRYPVIAGDFDLRHDASGWRIIGRDLELSTESHAWATSNLTANWQRDEHGLVKLSADATFLRLENLLPLASLTPDGKWRDRLFEFMPEGEVRALKAGYTRRDAGDPEMHASARFTGVGFSPVGKAPGLRGLTGELEGSRLAGHATLDSKAVQFTMPRKFRAPLSADLAQGRLDWTRDERGLHLNSRQFKVKNAHASAETDIDLTLPADDQSPLLELRSRFHNAVLAEGWRYLPIDKLTGKVLSWLDGAFKAGRAQQGEMVFSGPTRDFPFRGGGGEFRITFPVEGLTLNYAEDWSRLENAAVDVEFLNAGLTAKVKSGTVNGLRVLAGEAQFVDFKDGNLTIKARASGDVGAALGYVQKSPDGTVIGATFMSLRGEGPIAADVDLLLPVKHLADRRIIVDTRLDGARVSLADSPHVIEQLTGTLRIEDKRVISPALNGTYLGGPVHIELAPTAATASDGRFDNVVRVRATTPAPALAQALGAPTTVKLDGRVDWRALARLPTLAVNAPEDAVKAPMTLRVDSSLRGAAVDLPVPLAKTAEETRPLRVEIQWPEEREEALVRATYGSNVRSHLRFTRQADAWTFERGSVRFGEGESRLPAIAGLELRGRVDEIDLSDWLALRPETSTPGKRPVSGYLKSADISARVFRLFGFSFSEVSGSLIAGERAWSVSVDGPQARGIVLVPYDFQGAEPLVINMTRLSLDSEASADAENGSEPDPREWPNVSASIGQFSAWGRRFGFTRAELTRATDGLRLDSASAQSASFAMQGSGAWVVSPQGQQTSLKLELNSTDVLETMKDLDYGDSISGKSGKVVADVSWPGSPNRNLLASITGRVSIQVDDGQLLTVQPGAGRIFGLMSVAALPRRLSLDFTDFTDKGLAFDTIRGDFTLKSGDAYTDNLLLKGPAAEIGVVGRTGLEQRDYDQTAVVTGSLGQSLPVAGAIAGGPVVGAALLVFSQIFKEPLKGMARGYYRITGTWDNPVVQRVDGSEKKKAENTVRTAERPTDASP